VQIPFSGDSLTTTPDPSPSRNLGRGVQSGINDLGERWERVRAVAGSQGIELNDRADVLHAFLARLLVTSGRPDQALDELNRETAAA
jgi:hypothetical protein